MRLLLIVFPVIIINWRQVLLTIDSYFLFVFLFCSKKWILFRNNIAGCHLFILITTEEGLKIRTNLKICLWTIVFCWLLIYRGNLFLLLCSLLLISSYHFVALSFESVISIEFWLPFWRIFKFLENFLMHLLHMGAKVVGKLFCRFVIFITTVLAVINFCVHNPLAIIQDFLRRCTWVWVTHHPKANIIYKVGSIKV
jgi:hypothetical protein